MQRYAILFEIANILLIFLYLPSYYANFVREYYHVRANFVREYYHFRANFVRE